MSFLFFISFYTSVRLQNSIHSRNAKNWLLQKRYRQKGTHWHYILVMYYHVNKLQTHLPYGHYHKYNNYHWSASLNPARLSFSETIKILANLSAQLSLKLKLRAISKQPSTPKYIAIKPNSVTSASAMLGIPFFLLQLIYMSARLNVTQATLVYFYSRLLSLTNSTSTLLLLYFQDFDQNPWDGNVRWTTRLYNDCFSSLHRCDYRCCSLSQARARNSIRCWLWLINILHAAFNALGQTFPQINDSKLY